MSIRSEKAYDLFKQGYNCSQAVIGAFADCLPMSFEDAVKLAAPFGGGMGRMRETCGAFSGILMVLGCLKGCADPAASEEKAKLYSLVQQLAADFTEENGSVNCGVLLGIKEPQSPVPEKRTAEYYKKRPCPELVKSAVEILEKYI